MMTAERIVQRNIGQYDRTEKKGQQAKYHDEDQSNQGIVVGT